MLPRPEHRVLVLKGGGCFEFGLSLLLQRRLRGLVLTADYLDPSAWWLMIAGYQPTAIVVNGSGAVDITGLLASLASLSEAMPAVLVIREETNEVTVYEADRVYTAICTEVADFLALLPSTQVLV